MSNFHEHLWMDAPHYVSNAGNSFNTKNLELETV